MNRSDYLMRLLLTALGIGVLAILLHIVAGSRWFGFYGYATLVLVACAALSVILSKRYAALGLARWPALAILALIAIAAAVQISFWTAFFHSGTMGIGLAAGRSMVLPWIDVLQPYALTAAAVGVALLVWRGARSRIARQ